MENLPVACFGPGSSTEWPDTRLGPLEPNVRHFPFPGLVGSRQPPSPRQQPHATRPPRRPNYDADLLTAEQSYERQSSVFEQFVTVHKEVRMNTTSVVNHLNPVEGN